MGSLLKGEILFGEGPVALLKLSNGFFVKRRDFFGEGAAPRLLLRFSKGPQKRFHSHSSFPPRIKRGINSGGNPVGLRGNDISLGMVYIISSWKLKSPPLAGGDFKGEGD